MSQLQQQTHILREKPRSSSARYPLTIHDDETIIPPSLSRRHALLIVYMACSRNQHQYNKLVIFSQSNLRSLGVSGRQYHLSHLRSRRNLALQGPPSRASGNYRIGKIQCHVWWKNDNNNNNSSSTPPSRAGTNGCGLDSDGTCIVCVCRDCCCCCCAREKKESE